MMSEKFSRWRSNVNMCMSYQAKNHRLWRDSLDLFNCVFFEKQFGFDSERVDVHFSNWYISNLVALTYFRDPYIFIRPRNSKYNGFADTVETAINFAWRELELKKHMKKAIQSGFIMPPGWIKIGYTGKIGQDVAKNDQNKQKSLISDIKSLVFGKLNKEKSPEEQGVLDVNITEDSVFATWIPSWNILMPPGYHSVEKMPYLIEIEDMSVLDFKNNPMYKNKDMVVSSRSLAEYDSGNVVTRPYFDASTNSKDENEVIRLYHVWDRRSGERLTLSDKDIHFEGDWPYDIEGFPYEPLIFEESLPSDENSNSYPPNALTPILPQIIEKSQSRTMMVKHRKRAASALIYQKGLLTNEEIERLSDNEAMDIIGVSRLDAVTPLSLPPIQQDVFRVDDKIDQDLQAATNMGQMMFQPMPGTRTATQAQLGAAGLQLKAQARVDVVEDFTVKVATKLIQLMFQFYDRNRMSEIIGEPVTEDMWPNLPVDSAERKRIIRRLLNISIDAGSTAPPKDETIERKQLTDLLQVVFQIAPEKINKTEALKQVLKKFPFAKDLDRIVVSDDEAEMQAAAKETEFMLQGAPQVVSPNEQHEIHIKTHSQAAGNEIIDQHIAEHGAFMGVAPGVQGGNQDMSAMLKEGVTNEGDIMQSAQNLGVGTGPEAM